MPVSIDWTDDSRTLARYEILAPWTWDDLHTAAERLDAMLDSVDHPVDVLIDVRQMGSLPSSALGHLRSLTQQTARHPHWRLSLIIGASRLVQALMNTLTLLHPQIGARYVVVESEEQAYDQLRKRSTISSTEN
jgi:hypothetical protein